MQRPLRLHQRDDFERSRRNGHVWRQPLLHLSVSPNGLAHNRYGFITSKRVGGAVVRNRVRRQLREAVRALHSQLRPGHDLVWIARNEIAGKPYTLINMTVVDLCKRAGLIKPESAEIIK